MPVPVGNIEYDLVPSKRSEALLQQTLRNAEKSAVLRPVLDTSRFPLGRLGRDVSQFQSSLDAANQRVIAFGASAGSIFLVQRAFRELIASTVEVDKRLIEINSIFNLTKGQLDSFGSSLFNIARKTGQSFGAVADAAREFSRQGLGVEETLKRTQAALVLTRLSGLDAESAVRGLTTAINSFSKEVVDANRFVNQLANVDSQFAVSTKDLVDALSRVGSTAQDAGVSLNETIALVTALAQTTGRQGSVIGNSLKTIFTRSARSDTIDEFRALNSEINQTDSGIVKLQKLASVYKDLGASQQSQVRELLGGVYQINQVSAALADLTRQNSFYKNALDASNNAADTAVRRNEILNTSISAKANSTVQTLTQMAAKLGELALKPTLSNILGGGEKLARLFTPGDAEEQGFTVGEALVKGIGNALAGPGITLLSIIAANLARKVGGAIFGAVKTELKNPVDERREKVEASINNLLAAQPGLKAKVNDASLSQLQKEELIINALRQQNQLLVERAVLGKQLALSLVGRGVTPILGERRLSIPAKSGGFVPHKADVDDAFIREAIAIDRGDGGASKSARPVLKYLNMGNGVAPAVVNTDEKIIRNFAGTGQDAVFNKTMMNGAGDLSRFGRVENVAKGQTPRITGFMHTILGKEKYAEIIKNPTLRELKEMEEGGGVGAWVTRNDMFAWNRNNAYHYDVKTRLKLEDAVPIMKYGDELYVTDASRGSKYYHSGEAKKLIKSNPYFKDKEINIDYYDSDIGGKWHSPTFQAASGSLPFGDLSRFGRVENIAGGLIKGFHGTTVSKDFNIFKKGDVGFHFGTVDQAQDRAGFTNYDPITKKNFKDFRENARIFPVVANIKNPARTADVIQWDRPSRVLSGLRDAGILSHAEVQVIGSKFPLSEEGLQSGVFQSQSYAKMQPIRKILRQKGYDGIVYRNAVEGSGKDDSYIAFYPNQIKSQFNQNPNFNRRAIDMAQGGIPNLALNGFDYKTQLNEYLRAKKGWSILGDVSQNQFKGAILNEDGEKIGRLSRIFNEKKKRVKLDSIMASFDKSGMTQLKGLGIVDTIYPFDKQFSKENGAERVFGQMVNSVTAKKFTSIFGGRKLRQDIHVADLSRGFVSNLAQGDLNKYNKDNKGGIANFAVGRTPDLDRAAKALGMESLFTLTDKQLRDQAILRGIPLKNTQGQNLSGTDIVKSILAQAGREQSITSQPAPRIVNRPTRSGPRVIITNLAGAVRRDALPLDVNARDAEQQVKTVAASRQTSDREFAFKEQRSREYQDINRNILPVQNAFRNTRVAERIKELGKSIDEGVALSIKDRNLLVSKEMSNLLRNNPEYSKLTREQLRSTAGRGLLQSLREKAQATVASTIARGGESVQARENERLAQIRRVNAAVQLDELTSKATNFRGGALGLFGGFNQRKFDKLAAGFSDLTEEDKRNARRQIIQQSQGIRQARLFGAAIAAPLLAEGVSSFVNKGQETQTTRTISGVASAAGTGVTLGAFVNPVLGVVVGGLLAFKAVVDNITPSLKDMASRAQEIASEQDKQVNSIQAYLQAQSQLNEIITSGGTATQVRLAKENVSKTFLNIAPNIQKQLTGKDFESQQEFGARLQRFNQRDQAREALPETFAKPLDESTFLINRRTAQGILGAGPLGLSREEISRNEGSAKRAALAFVSLFTSEILIAIEQNRHFNQNIFEGKRGKQTLESVATAFVSSGRPLSEAQDFAEQAGYSGFSLTVLIEKIIELGKYSRDAAKAQEELLQKNAKFIENLRETNRVTAQILSVSNALTAIKQGQTSNAFDIVSNRVSQSIETARPRITESAFAAAQSDFEIGRLKFQGSEVLKSGSADILNVLRKGVAIGTNPKDSQEITQKLGDLATNFEKTGDIEGLLRSVTSLSNEAKFKGGQQSDLDKVLQQVTDTATNTKLQLDKTDTSITIAEDNKRILQERIQRESLANFGGGPQRLLSGAANFTGLGTNYSAFKFFSDEEKKKRQESFIASGRFGSLAQSQEALRQRELKAQAYRDIVARTEAEKQAGLQITPERIDFLEGKGAFGAKTLFDRNRGDIDPTTGKRKGEFVSPEAYRLRTIYASKNDAYGKALGATLGVGIDKGAIDEFRNLRTNVEGGLGDRRISATQQFDLIEKQVNANKYLDARTQIEKLAKQVGPNTEEGKKLTDYANSLTTTYAKQALASHAAGEGRDRLNPLGDFKPEGLREFNTMVDNSTKELLKFQGSLVDITKTLVNMKGELEFMKGKLTGGEPQASANGTVQVNSTVEVVSSAVSPEGQKALEEAIARSTKLIVEAMVPPQFRTPQPPRASVPNVSEFAGGVSTPASAMGVRG